MSIKLKVLGLGLLALMATSAFAVVNASATSNGHFVAEPPTHHLIVKGTEGSLDGHQLKFFEIKNEVGHPTVNKEQWIECTDAKYHGTLEGLAATTTTSVKVRPEYTGCRTNTEAEHKVKVDVDPNNTCGTNVFEFTSGGTGTVDVNCLIIITHPSCEITISPIAENKNLPGVTYTTTTEQNKHALTLHVSVKTIKGEFHGGICIFLGTTHYFEMVGTATVWGEDTAGNRVSVTHTTP